jgi:hypothetical protein
MTPTWSEPERKWTTAYLCLKGDGDIRPLVCFSPQTSGGGLGGQVLVNGNLPFAGNLIVVSCPKNSSWTATLSDMPAAKASEKKRAA